MEKVTNSERVDRSGAVFAMSHRARNLSLSADVSFVPSSASVCGGRVPMPAVEEEPGRLWRQGSVPVGRSSLRKKNSIRRTKSFRVTFNAKVTADDGDVTPMIAPVIHEKPKHEDKQKENEKEEKGNSLSKKIAHRKKPARRPTSHVPNAYRHAEDDDEATATSSENNETKEKNRRPSIVKLLDQSLLTPMEDRLRELALKYRKPKEDKKSRIPVPTVNSFKSSRVSSLASKFERQFKGN